MTTTSRGTRRTTMMTRSSSSVSCSVDMRVHALAHSRISSRLALLTSLYVLIGVQKCNLLVTQRPSGQGGAQQRTRRRRTRMTTSEVSRYFSWGRTAAQSLLEIAPEQADSHMLGNSCCLLSSPRNQRGAVPRTVFAQSHGWSTARRSCNTSVAFSGYLMAVGRCHTTAETGQGSVL